MSSTEITPPCPQDGQEPPRPLVPLPLSDDYDHDWMSKPDPEDTTQIWGHCADFCESTDSRQTSGLTVAEHGVWCQSTSTVWIDATDVRSTSVLMSTAEARCYTHGTYRRDENVLRNRLTLVQLALSGTSISSRTSRATK